jgi:hypothetical protein
MTPERSDERKDLLSEKYPNGWTDIDLNVAVPDEYTFPKRYWRIYPWDRPWVWLIDQNRWDDAVVYCIHRLTGQVDLSDLPFWSSSTAVPATFPRPDEILPRLCREGRIQPVKRIRHCYVLGPNSGVDAILRDVAFLQERPNPAYGFTKEDLDEQ